MNSIKPHFQPSRWFGSLAVLCFLCFSSSCLQNDDKEQHTTPELDSLRDQADKISEFWGDLKGIAYLDSVYHEFKNPTTADRFEYYYFLQDRYRELADNERAESYVDSMFWLLETTANTQLMSSQYAKVNILRADALFSEGDFTEAYEYYYRAKKLAENSTDTCILGYYNYRVALVLYRSEKYPESIAGFKEAFSQLSTCSDYISYYYRLQEILDNIGLAYYNLGQPDSALVYYNQSLEIIKEGQDVYGPGKNDLFDKAYAVVLGNMGSVYMQKHINAKAEAVFKESIALNSKKGYDNTDARYTQIKLAQLYLDENRLPEAFQALEAVKEWVDINPSAKVNLRLLNVMWQYWYKSGNIVKAFNFLSKYNELHDSIDKAKAKVLRMDIDERVANLDNAYQVQNLTKEYRARSNYLMIAGIIALLLFIIVLLAVQNWRKSDKNVKMLTSLYESIHEQKRQLENALTKLENADKEKDRILKAVSHDMRSPVNSALALSELLLADENITSDQKEYLELIKNSCAGALSLTKDLLEIATLSKENIKKDFVDINQFVSDNVELLHFRAAKKNQKIHIHLLPESVEVFINPEKIARVINNLVTNAIKFSPVDASIYIALKKINKGVQVSVHDSGIGIPDEIKNKIFDVFTEAKRFGTAGEEPYGLGLSITKQIVDAHDGKIWFESEIGKGTTFFFYLGL